MKFTIDRKVFSDLVHTIYPSVDPKGPLPSLSYIKVEAIKEGLVLSATNIATSAKAFRRANVLETGVTVIPGKTLYDIVSNARADSFGVEFQGNLAVIRAGKSTFRVHTLDAQQFPPIPEYGNYQFRPLIKEFFTHVNRVLFSASRDEARPHLQSVNIEPAEMTATDGHRMAVQCTAFPTERPLVVNKDSFATLSKIFSFTEGKDLQVAVEEGCIHFRTPDTAATVKLMQCDYVDYRRVIPTGECQIAEVQKAALREAIKLVTVVSGKTNQVRIDIQNGLMRLTSYSESIGEASDSVECQHQADISLAVSGKYLGEAIDHLQDEVVRIELRGPKSPIVIREKDYVSIIQPQALVTGS